MKTVLIVDDERAIIMQLGSLPKANGYKVLVAQDSVSGTAAAMKDSPDLVVLDICMPAGDGFTVARRMQVLPSTLGTPIIFMSGSIRPEPQKLATLQGAVAFLLKPVDPAKFSQAVQQALGDAPVTQPAA